MIEKHLDKSLLEVIPLVQADLCNQTYLGIPTLKNPFDAWAYEQIIFEKRPDWIVEVGVFCGGHLLRLANFCDLIGHGRVIGVDIDMSHVHEKVLKHPRVVLSEGHALEALADVQRVTQGERVMVIEDSDHSYNVTLAILEAYKVLIRSDDYFIVEDGICNHGVPFHDMGPYGAIETFLMRNPDFFSDRQREPTLSWNPLGYLRKR